MIPLTPSSTTTNPLLLSLPAIGNSYPPPPEFQCSLCRRRTPLRSFAAPPVMDHLEIIDPPSQNHRSGRSKHHMTAVLLQTSLTNLNKKRKLEAQQFGLPLPKQLCAYQTFLRKYSSLLEDIPESELETTESGEDSNTITEDIDSAMSIETKPSSSSSCPSTSEASWDSGWSRDALYSLESRCVTKPDLHPGNECDFFEQDFGWQLGDHHVECICAECEEAKIGRPTEQELEDGLYSNGVIPNSFVLSSGRWNVGQKESEEGKNKLTIDKEFERYFGTLMLH